MTPTEIKEVAERMVEGQETWNDDEAITVAREYLFLVKEQQVLTEALALLDKTFTGPLAPAEGGGTEQHREPVSPPDNAEVRGLRVVH